jgi:Cof subfamily protein (haloacid dehalogenase superfamily)
LNLQNTIIALDLDGTLLRADKSVSEFTVETLRKIGKKGAEIFFVTGRRKRVADDVLKPFNFPARLIANNGTTCFNRMSDERIYTHYFSKAKVEFVVDTLAEIKRTPVLIIDVDGITEDMVMERSHLKEKVYSDYYKRSSNYIFIEEDIKESKFTDKVTGMFLIKKNEELKSVISFLKSKTNGLLEFCSLDNLNFLPTHTILEVLDPGMTKWNAICRLKKIIGKQDAKVIAFGDDHNDIDMLTSADESYAMGNAIAAAKKAAKNIAPSNENDGVAKVLMEYGVQE